MKSTLAADLPPTDISVPMQLERDAPVPSAVMHDEGKPLECDPAERLLQCRVIPLAVLEDRSGDGRALLAEARQVGHVEMRSRAGVGEIELTIPASIAYTKSPPASLSMSSGKGTG